MNSKQTYLVGVNGSFVRKPATGIGQVSWHFIKSLSKATNNTNDNTSRFIIYVEEKIPIMLKKSINSNKLEFKIVKGWYKRDDLLRKILWEKFWLPKQIKKDKCQKFISPYQSATILSRKIKHLMIVHDIIPRIFPEYLNNWRKKIYYKTIDWAIERVSKILTISKFSQQEISKAYNIDLDKIKVNYIACDPIFQQEISSQKRTGILKKYKLSSERKYIFNFGGFDVRKNVGRTIEAYGKLMNKKIKQGAVPAELPRLVLGGKFYKHLVPLVTSVEEKIKEVCKKYNLGTDLFQLIGFVKQTDLPALYQSAEVFIYPSLYEGFGLPVLEAMWSKTPVVTSSTTSIPEVISKQAGYLVNDPTNIDEIKTQLQKALEDTLNNKQQKIDTAFAESQKFSWKKFTEQIVSEILK
jgi:glycosyltransferase involved in cell wall biosynthesis